MKGFIFITLFTVIFVKLAGFFLAQDSLLLHYLTYNHYAKQWDGMIWYTKAASNWFVGLICWRFDTFESILKTSARVESSFSIYFVGFSQTGFKTGWPSGLRRWIKAPISSGAWVRIPLQSNFCIIESWSSRISRLFRPEFDLITLDFFRYQKSIS